MLKSKAYVVQFILGGSWNYAKSLGKNCIKILIGRRPYFTYQDVFFRLYLLQLLGLRPIRKVTCIGFTGEGAGSQALMIMCAIAFARRCGFTYLHTPFAEIAHADRPMRAWVEAWEKHFNLGVGQEISDGDTSQIVNFAYNLTSLLPLFGFKDGVNDLVRLLDATVPEFRRRYYSNKSPKNRGDLTICAHVRRGDISPGRANYTETSLFVETIREVTDVLKNLHLKCKVCVFTQAYCADFADSGLEEIEVFAHADPIWSMQQLIEADVFIMSKSSFSYVAGIISRGIKICEASSYPPLEGWMVLGANGEFDRASFEKRLLYHLSKAQTLGA